MYKLDAAGRELPDQTPVAIPAYIKHRDQTDSIREMIRYELSREALNAGFESFEEADDFDVGDDFDPTSPYEEQFDPDSGMSLWDVPIEPELGVNAEGGIGPGEDSSGQNEGEMGGETSGQSGQNGSAS